MALSAKFSPSADALTEEEINAFNNNRRHFNDFRDWFFAEFGSVVCKDVQKQILGRSFNLMDEAELLAFRNFPQVHEKCSQIYTKAAKKVAEILIREENSG